MNHENILKLKEIIGQRWEGISVSENNHLKWREICESIGIERLRGFDHKYFSFVKDSVIVTNPDLYGTWLKIHNDTAEKILTLGMP